jgi:hypothetical protein
MPVRQSIQDDKMGLSVGTILFQPSIFAALIKPVAQTRNGDLPWRVCGV